MVTEDFKDVSFSTDYKLMSKIGSGFWNMTSKKLFSHWRQFFIYVFTLRSFIQKRGFKDGIAGLRLVKQLLVKFLTKEFLEEVLSVIFGKWADNFTFMHSYFNNLPPSHFNYMLTDGLCDFELIVHLKSRRNDMKIPSWLLTLVFVCDKRFRKTSKQNGCKSWFL